MIICARSLSDIIDNHISKFTLDHLTRFYRLIFNIDTNILQKIILLISTVIAILFLCKLESIFGVGHYMTEFSKCSESSI